VGVTIQLPPLINAVIAATRSPVHVRIYSGLNGSHLGCESSSSAASTDSQATAGVSLASHIRSRPHDAALLQGRG
jgi:hypothetical protein